MTDEEKIEAVEDALDGRPLIDKARAAFWDYFEELYYRFLTGCVSGGPSRVCCYFRQELNRVLGEARCDAIFDEEWAKWVAKNQPTMDPEVWEEFDGPSVEGMEEYSELANANYGPTRADREKGYREAQAEWIEDRKHLKNRQRYARKFYGVAA